MNIRNLIIVFVGLWLLSNSVFAQDTFSEKESSRPKIGLVMSGGGAKGFAYVGLLKVLEEINMPVDFVGGSSMGAIIAALYSTGYSPETIMQLIREQDWESFISDVQERKYVSYEEKLFSDKYVFSLPIEDRGLSLSKSINSSFNIDLMLTRLFSPATHITDFNNLPIPFLCVGTDLLTGEAVVLDKGNLARAVRASMAIPGYFSPTQYDGRYLIDGGVVNNYPAKYVKDMGADIIIGLDVQSGLKSNIEEIHSITTVLDQVISFNRVEANKKGMELTDHYVKIDMSYGMLDFTKYDSIIAVGERVGREHYASLKALADSLNQLEPGRKVCENTLVDDSLKIRQITWSDKKLKRHDEFYGYLMDLDHKHTTISDLENQMLLLNGTRTFNELRYEIESLGDDDVDIRVETGSVNKGNLSAGIHYDNVFGGSVLLNLTFRNINGGRSKLFTDVVLGENPRLKSMFIINNGFKPGFGMEADLYSLSFSQYNKGSKINKWNFDNMSFSAFMPLTIRNNYLFKLGFQYELFRFKQDVVIDPDYEAYNKFADYGNLYFSFNHDSRDKTAFPTSGRLIEAQFKHVFPFSNKWSDLMSNGSIISFRYNAYHRISDKLIYKPELFGGYTITDKVVPFQETQNENVRIPAVQHLFGFGGINPTNYVGSHISFTGLEYLERLGMFAGKVSTNFEYNFYPKLYATAMADVGILENEIHSFDTIKLLLGYGGKLSYDSILGPVEFVMSSSNIDSSLNVFFRIGFWF
ncbi:patatin-like phospholipase family protein [Prolixibacteraceae bacterium Z1-6]|uniref:Patatin-like phospholipase family protein n=1 Tax=Draconibacterium aestuarii TaxID=2998507 RepID=A0A9X3J5M8_9BACT|nr:patatin-like phospholipase family protein [Prolixibacteraceae bacterium Z1-6]